MRLLTFGGLQLEGSKFRRTKSLLLLAYLALEGPKARRELAEWFYYETKDPRDSLSAALAKLKKAIPDAFDSDTDRVWTQLECDAKELLSYLEQGDAKALELYEGAFLEGLDLSLGEELEEWVFSTREYLAAQVRERYLQEAERELAKDVMKTGQYAERAYSLAGAPELNPEDFQRIYHLLKLAKNPLSAKVLEEAEAYGIELNLDFSLEQAKSITTVETELERQHNLPQSTSSFVGRDQERLAVADLLSEAHCRLITLHGPGGIGKTRLAVQAANDQVSEGYFKDGVFFVPLDVLSSGEEIPTSIANTLGLSLQDQEEPLMQIIGYFEQKEVLLILDNFEQLIDAAMLPATLLKDCPKLKLIITSRERLQLTEEHVLSLSGLPLPDAHTKPEDLHYVEAIQLFVQRAKKATLAFNLDEESIPHVINLVHLLEGNPLAIELAASWVRVLALDQIVKEIESNLDFLSSVSPNIKDRHQSIRAAFGYSWQLLSKRDQDVLAKVAVFRGGFHREAASDVADATLASLVSLVDKSLLRVSSKGRFDRHALLYQFTREKLAKQGEIEKQTQEKHANFFLKLAEKAEPHLVTEQQKAWLARLDVDNENLHTALAWFLEHNHIQEALKLAGYLGHYWYIHGYFQQGRVWLKRTLDYTEKHPELRAKLLNASGALAFQQRDFAEARLCYEESLVIYQDLSDKNGVATSYSRIGTIAYQEENYPVAQSLFEESLRTFRALEENIGCAGSLNNLAVVAKALKDYASAQAYYQESLDIFQNLHHEFGIALGYYNLAGLAKEQEDFSAAHTLYKTSLTISQAINDKLGIAMCLGNVALLMAEKQMELAVPLWASVQTLRDKIQAPLTDQDQEDFSLATKNARRSLGNETFEDLWTQGKTTPLEQVIELALMSEIKNTAKNL